MNPTWTCMKFTWNLQDTYMTPTWNLHGTYMKSLHQKSSGKHIWTETRKRHTLNLHEPHLKPTWSKDMAHYWNNLQLSHFMFYVWSFHWICVILFMFDWRTKCVSVCYIFISTTCCVSLSQRTCFSWVLIRFISQSTHFPQHPNQQPKPTCKLMLIYVMMPLRSCSSTRLLFTRPSALFLGTFHLKPALWW